MKFARRLRRRILRRSLGVALAGALLAAGSAGTAGAMPEDPCRQSACTVTLTVDEAPARWASIEHFYPYNEDVGVMLSSSGRSLREASSGGENGCRRSFKGAAMVATIRACGADTPLRIRAKRLRPGMADLIVTYQAVPFVDGSG